MSKKDLTLLQAQAAAKELLGSKALAVSFQVKGERVYAIGLPRGRLDLRQVSAWKFLGCGLSFEHALRNSRREIIKARYAD